MTPEVSQALPVLHNDGTGQAPNGYVHAPSIRLLTSYVSAWSQGHNHPDSAHVLKVTNICLWACAHLWNLLALVFFVWPAHNKGLWKDSELGGGCCCSLQIKHVCYPHCASHLSPAEILNLFSRFWASAARWNHNISHGALLLLVWTLCLPQLLQLPELYTHSSFCWPPLPRAAYSSPAL